LPQDRQVLIASPSEDVPAKGNSEGELETAMTSRTAMAMGESSDGIMNAPGSARSGGKKATFVDKVNKTHILAGWEPSEEQLDEEVETVEGGPAQELVRQVRTSMREQNINLLQAFSAHGETLNLQTFVQVIRDIVGEDMHGLVQRGAEDLFDALDADKSGAIQCSAAAEALALDSRGNPLRTAGQSQGDTASAAPGVQQDTAAAASGGASAAGWTLGYMKDQLQLALSQLKKLIASRDVLQQELEQAQAECVDSKRRVKLKLIKYQ
jgi:hypothetical protein